MVATWWKSHFSPDEGVKEEEEEYASNWFEIAPKPETLFFHEISRSGPGPVLPSAEFFSYPVVPHGRFLISFAEAELLSLQLGDPHKISRSIEIPFHEFASDDEKVANIERRERRSYIANLLRQSWELFIRNPEVVSYELANGHTCIFYPHRQEKATRMPFKGLKGGIGFRALTGYKTVSGPTPDSKKKRFWHFAISMRPLTYPILGYAVYYHVLFSDDGRTPWESKERMHAARRRQCWDWWNDDWRDRIIAFLTSLAKGGECLPLPAGEKSLGLSLSPLLFTSPLTYEVTGKSSVASRKDESGVGVGSEEVEDLEEEMDDDNDVF
jgi:hypothetical protein